MISAGLPALDLPPIGFGGAPLGNLFHAVSATDSGALLDRALGAGLRYFDTAPHYGLGLSERRLGAALAGRDRSQLLVSTKVGRVLDPSPATASKRDGDGFDVPAAWRRRRDYSRDGILRSVEHSLIRTGLDRFDVLFLHDPDEHWEAASTTGVATLAELRDEGVVRAIGVGMNQAELLTRFVRETDIDLVMVAGRYTLADQTAERELLPAAQERGVGVLAVGVYNSGLLARDRVPDDTTFDYAAASPEVVARARAIAAVCERHGVSLPAAALAFPRRHPAVTSIVVGMQAATQVDETLERLSAPVPEDLWQELAAEGLISG
ncbi:aldo/keto reductase [uncultured Amnibacterium sp.]|uniref:aldo/keto reductase n=1 Tax=uncultured Amnibacterium sp. TaxID=1631851 RepID=UPI0035CADF44